MKYLLATLLLPFSVYADDEDRIGTEKPVFLQSITIESQNATGFSNMLTSVAAEIGSGNPAGLDNFSSFAAGFNYYFQSEADYYADIKIYRAKAWLPSSVGFVYPLENWRFGLSYRQKYSNYTDYGKIQITTIENPDGGE